MPMLTTVRMRCRWPFHARFARGWRTCHFVEHVVDLGNNVFAVYYY